MDFAPRCIAVLAFVGGIDGVFVSPVGVTSCDPMVPTADIMSKLFRITADAASQCDLSGGRPVQGPSLLNTRTTHRQSAARSATSRTPGPGLVRVP